MELQRKEDQRSDDKQPRRDDQLGRDNDRQRDDIDGNRCSDEQHGQDNNRRYPVLRVDLEAIRQQRSHSTGRDRQRPRMETRGHGQFPRLLHAPALLFRHASREHNVQITIRFPEWQLCQKDIYGSGLTELEISNCSRNAQNSAKWGFMEVDWQS